MTGLEGITGVMGKFILGILGLTLACAPALAKPRLARVLPSQVKTINLEPRKKAPKQKNKIAKASYSAPTVNSKQPSMDLSPELKDEADAHPFSSKFFSRSVYFVRSDYEVPAEYDCDEATVERKKQEAESQAASKCAESGLANCNTPLTVLVKSGELRCDDFPGKRCPGRGHFRGCVAESLVLGEKS